MGRLNDTTSEAQRVLDKVYREMPAWRKWERLGGLYRYGRELHAAGVRLRKPGITPAEIRADWLRSQLGFALVDRYGGEEGRDVDAPIEMQQVVGEVVAALNALGIAYALGGSLASSIHGVSRNTLDADLTVEPFAGKEARLTSCFGPDYSISLDAVRQAVRDRSSFNISQTRAGIKVDVFVQKERPFELSLMKRRVTLTSPTRAEETLDVVSAEDVVLLKLEWYRLGGETSDRQWTDVQNVLRVQEGRLDDGYLDHWAAELAVSDLLARARDEAKAP